MPIVGGVIGGLIYRSLWSNHSAMPEIKDNEDAVAISAHARRSRGDGHARSMPGDDIDARALTQGQMVEKRRTAGSLKEIVPGTTHPDANHVVVILHRSMHQSREDLVRVEKSDNVDTHNGVHERGSRVESARDEAPNLLRAEFEGDVEIATSTDRPSPIRCCRARGC